MDSSNDLYEAQLDRGRLLREHGRYEDAIGLFEGAIASDPEDPTGYVEKALCELHIEDRDRDALDSIEEGIRLDPDSGFNHAVRSIVLTRLDRPKEALTAADQALAIDPAVAFHLRVKGQAYAGLEKWAEAEKWLRRALAEDPDDDTAANILATVLRVQNKPWENEFEVQRLLAKNPENELTHYNAGWSCLQRGDRERAEEHFREALRIDPNFDGAREGLVDCFRARSAFYRVFLRYSFFMQRFSAGSRWAIVIGLFLAVKFWRPVLEVIHPSLSIALGFAYLLFVFWGWLAPGIGSFIVLTDRSARHALKFDEKREAVFVGGAFFMGIVFLVGTIAVSPAILLPIVFGCLASSIPFSYDVLLINHASGGSSSDRSER